VRRAAGPWTATIQAFMSHLHESGFSMVPKPLGIDDRGREVISLLPGSVATYPLPPFAWSDETLVAVARVLRAFHDASIGFLGRPGACWQWPSHQPEEVVCHNDFAPYNLMFEDDVLTGVIDLDLASPGPRVWDMAYAAYRFVPLTDPANPDAPFPGTQAQARRLAAFCAAYDHPAAKPLDVLRAAAAKLDELVAFIEREAARGDAAQQAVLARGDDRIYRRDIAHIEGLAAA
jgi:Ser/Thr protein kinase RdoA (MazF antagonist)